MDQIGVVDPETGTIRLNSRVGGPENLRDNAMRLVQEESAGLDSAGSGGYNAGEGDIHGAQRHGEMDPPKVSYDRPSGYRKGMRDKVWENSKNSNGEVLDPVTRKVIDPKESWDMGHKPGFEFRKHQQSARERGLSRKELLDKHNNPEHDRPELPGSNRSHLGEDTTNRYFGPHRRK